MYSDDPELESVADVAGRATAGPASGRILALDLGEKRIGVAVSDPTQRVARSLVVVRRRSRREDFQRFGALVAQQAAVLVVMGLPIPLSGGESRATRWVRDYGAALAASLDVPLVFWDESLTTQAAERLLVSRGVSARRRRGQVDAIAAAFILQSFLDARHPPPEALGPDRPETPAGK